MSKYSLKVLTVTNNLFVSISELKKITAKNHYHQQVGGSDFWRQRRQNRGF